MRQFRGGENNRCVRSIRERSGNKQHDRVDFTVIRRKKRKMEEQERKKEVINARSERSLLGCGVTNGRSSIRIGFTRSMRAEIWNAVRSRLQNATSILSFFFSLSFHLNSRLIGDV